MSSPPATGCGKSSNRSDRRGSRLEHESLAPAARGFFLRPFMAYIIVNIKYMLLIDLYVKFH